ncbi:YihY/virulence factor BrkB family protein [Bifidobacterium callimiconis]|nr:YihY/virulence factor BrkB family protein [Bifidobacterium callimiconis]MBT1176728.1 YihY/virulence factor BrkB family protein [Bifidobacterium callimiconis]
MHWWKRSLPGRLIDRYLSHRGSLMGNGLAYGLLFAFFGGVWMALSLAGVIVIGNEQLQRLLIDAVNTVIPGSADTFLSASVLAKASNTFTWTGLVTVVIFWWTVTGWMDSLRTAVQDMFDDYHDDVDLVKARLRDTAAAMMVTLLFILSTVAGTVSSGLVRALLTWLGIPGDSFAGSLALDVVGLCSGLILNFLLFLLLFRVVAHIHAGRFMIAACALGAVTLTVMQLFGTKLLGGASRNPLLAPFAAIIGVLIWFNLVAQVIMICSAFIAECRHDPSLCVPTSGDRTVNDRTVSNRTVSDRPVNNHTASDVVEDHGETEPSRHDSRSL